MLFIATTKIKNLTIVNSCGYNYNLFRSSAVSSLAMESYSSTYVDYVNDNIPINMTLKSLEMNTDWLDLTYFSHFPNIETLKLEIYECRSSDSIVNLSKLQKLLLTFDNHDFSHILSLVQKLSIKNSLKSLKLANRWCCSKILPSAYEIYIGQANSLALALFNMTNLEELTLNTKYSFERHLPQFRRKLNNLKKNCCETTLINKNMISN